MALASQLTRCCSRQRSLTNVLQPHLASYSTGIGRCGDVESITPRNLSCLSTAGFPTRIGCRITPPLPSSPSRHHAISPTRSFSTTRSNDDADFMAQRIQQLQMNPDSLAKDILPGNVVKRVNPRTSKERMIYTERAYGYFWMINDLGKTNNKPILSNPTLIAEAQAQVFPSLENLVTLQDEVVNLPDFFRRTNRTNDPTAQCTLVAISFRDFGFKLLPSWLQPFELAFEKDTNRVNVVRISIVEGWIVGTLLKGLVTRSLKKNTPKSQYAQTLLKFGNSTDFVDALRMHNTMTGYVFLLDGLGRVRFGGSGGATEKEAESLIKMTKKLLKAHTNKIEPIDGKKTKKRGRDFQR